MTMARPRIAPHPRHDGPPGGLVARAVAAQRARVGRTILLEELRRLQIHAHARADGLDATAYLAESAWLLGMGAEVALAMAGPQAPITRRLHGALRTLAGMCHAGYLWRAEFGPPLDAALQAAHDILVEHAASALQFRAGADYVAHRIRSHTLTPGDIAGAEIYASAAPAAPPPERMSP